MNLDEAILSVYPKARACVNGHKGKTVSDIVVTVEDDRIEREYVYRCSYCRMTKDNKIQFTDNTEDFKVSLWWFKNNKINGVAEWEKLT